MAARFCNFFFKLAFVDRTADTKEEKKEIIKLCVPHRWIIILLSRLVSKMVMKMCIQLALCHPEDVCGKRRQRTIRSGDA